MWKLDNSASPGDIMYIWYAISDIMICNNIENKTEQANHLILYLCYPQYRYVTFDLEAFQTI